MNASEYLVPDPYNPGAWLVCKDGADQSWIDPLHPDHLEFDYMRRIAAMIDTWASTQGLSAKAALRVVHIGGAGMSLARWLSATRPGSAQIVFEPDVALTAAVRQLAPLGKHSGVKVRAVDGRAGLADLDDHSADVVILDAFDNAQVPASLVSAEFMGQLARCLDGAGLLAVNLVDARPFDWARRVVSTVTGSFTATCLLAEQAGLKAKRVTNLVVGASPRDWPLDGLIRAMAGAPFPCAVLDGDDLTRWLGGARPFCDADAQPSPPRSASELTWYG